MGVVRHPINWRLKMPPMYAPGRIHVGDIVFVGNRLMRILVTRKLRDGFGHQSVREANALWEGTNVRTGKTLKFFKRTVRQKSPMSPLEPTVYPRAQAIGIHHDCGGTVMYSPTRHTGDRYCDRCRADGRFGRPRPLLDSEVNPIGRK
jgi:hypothetical protein